MARSMMGTQGSCTFPSANCGPLPGTDCHLYEWHARVVRDIIDDTNFDSTADAWRRKIGGMARLMGNAVGCLATGRAFNIGASTSAFGVAEGAIATVGFVLTTQSECTWTFTGLVTNINTTVNKTGRTQITMDFQSCSDITVA